MIALWIAYALVTGALVALVCWLLEQIARAARLATRGVWVGGMTVMVLIGAGAAAPEALAPRATSPALATARPPTGTSPAQPAADRGRLPPQGRVAILRDHVARAFRAVDARLAAAAGQLARWDRPLLVLWALVAAFLTGVFAHAALEGRRLRHGLETREVAGTSVLLTEGVGPSAAGVGDPAILLPRWTLDLDDALLTLVLRHEREHLAARDPLLLLVALLGVVLLPWHLPLWWSWQRLRLAIEVDCDSRVLRAHPDVGRYAQLLLLTGQRTRVTPWASRAVVTVVAPLQPHASHLARRIFAMTELRTSRSPLHVALLAGGVTAVASLACALPMPRQAEAQASTAPGRVLVRLTSVGLDSVGPSPSILIYSAGGARVGIGTDTPRVLTDTLRLTSLPAITADVTDGDVHIQLVGPGRLRVGGAVTGGPALRVSATGRHIVLPKGGVGIQTLP